MPKKHNPGGCCGCNPAPPCVLCNATEYRKNLRVQLSAGIAPANYEWDFEIACFPNSVRIMNVVSESYTHLKRIFLNVQLSSTAFGNEEIIHIILYQEHIRYDLVNSFGNVLVQSERVEFGFRPSATGSCAHTRYGHFPCTVTPDSPTCSGVSNIVQWQYSPLDGGWPNFPFWHQGYQVGLVSPALGWPDPPIFIAAEFNSSFALVAYHLSCTLSWVDP